MSNTAVAMTTVRDRYGHTRYIPISRCLSQQQEKSIPKPLPADQPKTARARADRSENWRSQIGIENPLTDKTAKVAKAAMQ